MQVTGARAKAEVTPAPPPSLMSLSQGRTAAHLGPWESNGTLDAWVSLGRRKSKRPVVTAAQGNQDGGRQGWGGHAPVVPSVQARPAHPCCPWHPESREKKVKRRRRCGRVLKGNCPGLGHSTEGQLCLRSPTLEHEAASGLWGTSRLVLGRL